MFVRDYIVKLHDLLSFRVYYGDMTIKNFVKYLQKNKYKTFRFWK